MGIGTTRDVTVPHPFAAFAFAVVVSAATGAVISMVWTRAPAAPAPADPPTAPSAELARLADRIDALVGEVAALRAMPRVTIDQPERGDLTATTAGGADLESVRQLILKLMHDGKADATAVEIQAALLNKPETDLAAVTALFQRLESDEASQVRATYRFLSKRQIVEKLGPPQRVDVRDGEQIWMYVAKQASGDEYWAQFNFHEGYVIKVKP